MSDVYTHEIAREKIEQVREGANPDWLTFAEHCARYVAQFKAGPDGLFTVDDVWAEIEHRRTIAGRARLPETPELRAMGAVMQKLSKAGVIEFTGSFIASTRRHTQRQPVRVWRMAAQS
jgi:hypothetical protein